MSLLYTRMGELCTTVSCDERRGSQRIHLQRATTQVKDDPLGSLHESLLEGEVEQCRCICSSWNGCTHDRTSGPIPQFISGGRIVLETPIPIMFPHVSDEEPHTLGNRFNQPLRSFFQLHCAPLPITIRVSRFAAFRNRVAGRGHHNMQYIEVRANV